MQALRLGWYVFLSLALMTSGFSSRVFAQGSNSDQQSNKEAINVKLHDLELIDQDGQRLKFRSDVIGDRVAVVIPFYTTCTTAYPILIFMFTRLQEMLGPRLGKEVVLVSISVDPRTDIPVRLKAFARRQKAMPGWVFLSGDRTNLGQVLWGVGVLFSSNLEEHDHIPITMVGSANGEWRRFHGFPSPEQVLAQVEEALAASRAGREG
jgi:protein SCO1/2